MICILFAITVENEQIQLGDVIKGVKKSGIKVNGRGEGREGGRGGGE